MSSIFIENYIIKCVLVSRNKLDLFKVNTKRLPPVIGRFQAPTPNEPIFLLDCLLLNYTMLPQILAPKTYLSSN